MIELTPEQVAERVRSFRDHERFCRETLTIANKGSDVVPLQLSPAQVKLNRAIRDQERRGLPVRGVCLKARQVHMSVGVAAEIWKRCGFLPGQHGIVFADTYKTVRTLWGYYEQFQLGYRPRLGHAQLPPDVSLDGQRISWGDQSSYINFVSAERATAGHGQSNRHVHASEYAFWRDASKQMTRLLPSVPNDPYTTVIVESTANGMGGPFWELWQRESDWFKLFFAWWEHPEYWMPLDVDVTQFQQSITREERGLVQNHGLKLEQIRWRRWCIRENCEGSFDRFHQEYPSTAEEAFLTSGRPRFDIISIGRQPRREPALVGELERITVGTEQRIVFRESASGILQVWRRPEVGMECVIGADPAHGIDPGSDSGRSDPDYSVAPVLTTQGDQVAVLRARLTPSAFGQYLALLGWWYNGAFLVPEANPIGVALIEELLRQRYPVEWIYSRLRDASDRRNTRLQDLGYLTTEVSKPLLISALDRVLTEESIMVHDPVTLQELRTYVFDSKGKTNASPGSHDDCVIALALSVIGIAARAVQMPKPKPQLGQQPQYRRTISYR